MKQLLFLGLLCGCTLPGVANAAPLPVAPVDTVSGHAHLVRKLMQSMCASLPGRGSSSDQKRTGAEATQYARQLYAAAVNQNSAAYHALLDTSDKAGIKHEEAVKRVAQDVQASLWRKCPNSATLFSQFAQTEQMKQFLAARLLDTGAAERLVLLPVATKVCKGLADADKESAISKRTVNQQDVLVEGLIRKNLAASRPQLETFYSKAQLANQEYIREILVKVMLLAIGQDGCGYFLMPPAIDE